MSIYVEASGVARFGDANPRNPKHRKEVTFVDTLVMDLNPDEKKPAETEEAQPMSKSQAKKEAKKEAKAKDPGFDFETAKFIAPKRSSPGAPPFDKSQAQFDTEMEDAQHNAETIRNHGDFGQPVDDSKKASTNDPKDDMMQVD